MIKGRYDNTVFIGLEDINVEMMKEGRPIVFNLKDLDFDTNIQIVIVAGKDTQELKGNFIEHGAEVKFETCGDVNCRNCVGDNRV